MYGRYLKVLLTGKNINKEFLSEAGFGEEYLNIKQSTNPPRIVVKASLKKNAYTIGKVSLYNLSNDTIKLLEANEYNVIITAGYRTIGISQIVCAKKKYTEQLRIGSDLIFNIYFLSGVLEELGADTIIKSKISDLIISQCNKFGFKTSFEGNVFNNTTIDNITLKGNLYQRLNKLQSVVDFGFYEQNNQIIIAKDDFKGKNIINIDTTDGLLSIPAYSRVGFKINFKIMMNTRLFIGQQFKLTNKYQRIAISDENKTFASDIINNKILNIKDVVFTILDMNYNLDTMGDSFNIEIEGYKPEYENR